MTTTSLRSQSENKFAWRLVLQLFTAIVGGYLLVNSISIFVAFTFFEARAYVIAYGLIFGLLAWSLVILWVFAHKSLWRGCGVVWLATAIFTGLSLLIKIIG